jgi:hypothetical protein
VTEINPDYVRKLLEHHNASIEASRIATQNLPTWAKYYTGISGCLSNRDEISIAPDLLTIRRLQTRPHLNDVYRASLEIDRAAIEAGRWIDHVSHEFAIGDVGSLENSLWFSYLAAVSIAIISGLYVSMPIPSKISIDSILCAEKNSVSFGLSNATQRYQHGLSGRSLNLNDADRIHNVLSSMLEMHKAGENLRFQIACQLLFSWSQTQDERIALAGIWSGIDAVFGKNETQAKRNLARRINGYLKEIGEEEVIEAYTIRCDAVHGRHCKRDNILDGIEKSERILRKILEKATLEKCQPLPDET